MKRWFISLTLSTIAVGLSLPFGGGTVLADAHGKASCVGIEASSVAPPGSSDELPRGAAQLSQELRALAGSLGVPPGALYAGFAKIHAGSHEACDAAVA